MPICRGPRRSARCAVFSCTMPGAAAHCPLVDGSPGGGWDSGAAARFDGSLRTGRAVPLCPCQARLTSFSAPIGVATQIECDRPGHEDELQPHVEQCPRICHSRPFGDENSRVAADAQFRGWLETLRAVFIGRSFVGQGRRVANPATAAAGKMVKSAVWGWPGVSCCSGTFCRRRPPSFLFRCWAQSEMCWCPWSLRNG